MNVFNNLKLNYHKKQFDNDWKMTINRLFNNGLKEEKVALLKKEIIRKYKN